jgi:hypothetical protein
MKTFDLNIDGTLYHVEQPNSNYQIFYINRKHGTFCIAKDKDKNWIVEMQVEPANVPIERLGSMIENYLQSA